MIGGNIKMGFIHRFAFALTFFTRLPFPYEIDYDETLPSKSMGLYPLIGIIIALILIVFSKVAFIFLEANIVNVLLLILLVYITGGLHLDGFIDSVDGLFSCRKKERILEIMHDSLIGSFGAIAVILLFLLKFNLFLNLTAEIRFPVFILMTVISRWMVVFSTWKYPLAVSSSLGKGFNYHLSLKQLVEAAIYVVISMFFINYLFTYPIYFTLIIFIVSLFITHLFASYVIKKIDGLTGDIYGAINEIVEVVVLLTAIVLKGVFF